jgi:predicted nucleic acid-binding Zn ribbon protein
MPRAVGDLLADAVPQLAERLAELRLHRSWVAVVGSDIARRTRPGSLVEGCLTVLVDNSPWLHELSLRQPELLARIRARCDSVRVLRFTVGSLGSDPEAAVTHERRPAPALSERDRREIEEATATISDTVLAATAQRLLTRARLAAGASGSR